MKLILDNKKKIIGFLLGLLVILVSIIIVKSYYKDYTKKAIELGNSLYEEVHNLYYYGGDLSYEKNEDGKYVISNYETVENLISKTFLTQTNTFLNIEKKDNTYYINPTGRGLSNYYGTELKIKKVSKKKIEYIAMTKLCYIDKIVSYGDGCATDGYYTVDKPFTIIKEDGKWKIESFTSIFEFDDSDIK
jgi:hypothetical protein